MPNLQQNPRQFCSLDYKAYTQNDTNPLYTLEGLLGNSTLAAVLPNLHREGQHLAATCPKCQHNDRSFHCGPGTKIPYSVWSCRHCGHSITTASLLGRQRWTVPSQPAVKAWQAPTDPPAAQISAIRELYASLTEFAQVRLPANKTALDYLLNRGLTLDEIQQDALGFLNWALYRQWYTGLTPAQQAACAAAGLPSGDKERATGFAAMFAGGYQGKIVFPYRNQAGEVVDLRTRSVSHKDSVGGRAVRYTSPKLPVAARGVNIPYGIDMLGNAPRVLLTEGEFKTLLANRVIQTVGLRGTADFRPEYLPHLRHRVVVLAFDNDDKKGADGLTAGQSATVKIGRLLRAHGIDVIVLDPAKLRDQKGVDDFINAYGEAAFAELMRPSNLVTLPEFEAQLTRNGADLSKYVTPRPDPGTVRQWKPADQVDALPHLDQPTVSVQVAGGEIRTGVADHLNNYRRGNKQLLVTAPAGVGKTTDTLAEAQRYAEANGKTIAVILPNHSTIDEKVQDGTLEGFKHIYGHNADNCQQHETANALVRLGYSPGGILCPNCPVRKRCEGSGYKAQFKGKMHRAYVHAHLHSDYPGYEDIVIVDELTHKQFVEAMEIWPGDITNALASGAIAGQQRKLLEALLAMFSAPDLPTLEGAEFYETLERFFPALHDLDAWSDGAAVQSALADLALEFAEREHRNAYEAAELPRQFGDRLFAALAEDVRRLHAGYMPTGRIRMVTGGTRRIELTAHKGDLPGWYGKRPTVVLNATADHEIMQDLIGPVKVISPQVAIAEGNEIIQDITRNNAKSAYTGSSPEAQKRRQAWLENIRHHISQHPGGESDTTIITTKALALHLTEAFPAAKVAYYHTLEGRNDLQAGLTILANTLPVNLDAVKRECAALYPGADLTLTRGTVAFDEANAGGELLAVEQVDAIDPRLQRLIWQHRDAAVIQAVHRARLIRQSGRKVVVMFSRPIPGLKPTSIIRDYADAATKATQRTQDAINRLINAGRELLADVGGFSVESLAMVAEASAMTSKKYFADVAVALNCQWFDVPVIQTLANGGKVKQLYRVAMPVETLEKHKLHGIHEPYKYDLISLVDSMQPLLPAGREIDPAYLAPPTEAPAQAAEPVAEPTPAELPARWPMAKEPARLKRSLLTAGRSEDASQRLAARTVIEYLNARSADRSAAATALWTLGEPYALVWTEG